MKRNKKVKNPDPVEESIDDSDTEEIPSQAMTKRKAVTRNTKSTNSSDTEEIASPQAMKKGKAITRKTRNTKSEDTEEIALPQAMKKGKAMTRQTRNIKSEEAADTEEISSPQPVKKEKARQTRQTRNMKSEESSDTEEIASPQAIKKGKAITRKTRNIRSEEASDTEEISSPQPVKKEKARQTRQTRNMKSEESSDSEDTSNSKLPVKNVKKKQKKPVESSDYIQVAGSSHNTESEGMPSVLKKKVRVKKANVPYPEDNSDTTVKSVLPENLSQIVKKRITRRDSSTTDPSDNSDSEEKPQKPKKKGKKVIKKEETEEASSSDSGSDDHKPVHQPVHNPIKKEKKFKWPHSPLNTDDSELDDEAMKHRNDLDHLRRVDPEFYEFLREQGSDLLEFNDHEHALDGSDEDDNDERGDSGGEQEVHVPGELHGGSDESDFEADGMRPSAGNVTLKMVHDLESELQKSCTVYLGTITKIVKIFNAAVLRATSEDGTTEGEFRVAGSSVFNAVLNMCVVYLPNAIGNYLGFQNSEKDPQKCKHFVKIKGSLIEYLSNLLKLLPAVSSENILTTMLKHLHQLSKYVACFSRIAKNAIKKLLPLWSAGEETVRVLSFMCILRITRNNENTLLVPVLKAMFMTYIRNSKFVSPTTWPGINFMRRSLVEMFALDLDRSYPNVFLYVRQLGIHLRNAIIVPKVEHRQAVFNWQYMNSLHLWAELVSKNVQHSGMKSLNFPLVMIISNTIKLGPTPQYYPLRFYLIEILMKIEEASGEFITIMPFFMDVITKFDINKKHKKASMKPLDFSCIIRLSKSQMNESGFKDAVVERLYALLLEYTASMSYKMIFPDCCMVLILFFRDLVAKCNNSNHKKKLKQLLDKIVENSEYITKKRQTFNGTLAKLDPIVAWENQIKAQGTPLLTYYENWKKLSKIQKRKAITKNDELAGVLPLIKRPKVKDSDMKDKPDSQESGPVNLFPSDSEDEKDETVTATKEVTKKQKKKKQKKVLETSNTDEEADTEASNIDESEVSDTGDLVSEFTW